MNIIELETEKRNKDTYELDMMTPLEIVKIMNTEDYNVIKAVEKETDNIAKVIELAVESLKQGGRIIYIGAGTSGRLGILDSVECSPTFGVDDNTVVGIMAGGTRAFVKAIEGAEDNEELGVNDLKAINLTNKDIVIGIAASGRTPYVIAAQKYAKSIGCYVAAVVCTSNSKMSMYSDATIAPLVGAEVLTGSTRLKSGSAQKMVLNMISTGSMVGIGKVYQNLMVDLVETNHKLSIRAENIVIEATGCTREVARQAINNADGKIKIAIVTILLNCSVKEAKERLTSSNGFVRTAIK